MAATLADLRSRLASRLGWTRIHSTAETGLEEAINAAISEIGASGAPGVKKRIFSAKTWTPLVLSNFSHSAGASTATTTDSNVSNVLPGDILVAGSVSLLLYGFDPSPSPRVFNLGAAVESSLGSAATVYRRSIALPTAGSVLAVKVATRDRMLQRMELGTIGFGTERDAEPMAYEQTWDTDREGSILRLHPAPTSATELVIVQTAVNARLAADTDELPWTDAAVEDVLARAELRLKQWGRGTDQIEALLAQTGVSTAANAAQQSSRARGALKQTG